MAMLVGQGNELKTKTFETVVCVVEAQIQARIVVVGREVKGEKSLDIFVMERRGKGGTFGWG